MPDPTGTPTRQTLGHLGGKAANLQRLRAHGFPVPPFVVLDTSHYREFVATHHLDADIAAALRHPDEQAARLIRAAFRRDLPGPLKAAIVEQLRPLAHTPVAVRSSATAEDLPDASFAGQQDTFLNISGEEAIVEAVRECWSSLWTERAISYRRRNNVPNDDVALAVVVQQLVPAEASGVAFTADPLTGHRGRTIVEAVPGLGDQLVSGQVTPEHHEVETATNRVLSAEAPPTGRALTPQQLRHLVALTRRVAEAFGEPQDIEWVRVGDDFSLVQTRPITSLYPLPPGAPRESLWISFGAVQGMLDPITPLGQDAWRMLLAGGGRYLGRRLDWRTNSYYTPAGGRLWLRADDALRCPIGGRLQNLLSFADPSIASAVRGLAAEPWLARKPLTSSGRFLRDLARLVARVLLRAPHILLAPDRARRRVTRVTDASIERFRAEFADAARQPTPHARLAARLRALERLGELPGEVAPVIAPPLLIGQLCFLSLLHRARTQLPDGEAVGLTLLRSLPGNVTAEMGLELWERARRVQADPAGRDLLAAAPEELDRLVAADALPTAARRELDAFLTRYGMRGPAEIDLGRPRWLDEPATVVRTMASHVASPDSSPAALFALGEQAARAAVESIAALGRPRLHRWLAHRARHLVGLRETPKFTFVRVLSLARRALLDSGADLVAAGLLAKADDVFYLHFDELRHIHEPALDTAWQSVVAGRRAAAEREGRRGRVPVVLVGDGRAQYDGGASPDADLAGLGVSPGQVEGRVRVVASPQTARLRPGEILVCRGTDPAWTPLFLTAGGLITEVGGTMTHGSVVAREYGIPAIVGVPEATARLRNGQLIRLDGTTGAITWLDDGAGQRASRATSRAQAEMASGST